MEKRLILEWVNGSGDGDGWGSGWGSDDGSGWGDGDGDGWGDGSGEGSGEGSDDGSGWGDGWVSGWDKGLTFLKAKGNDIYYIDDVPTAITSIFGNFTKGFVLQRDFSTKKCFIAKDTVSGLFAHGGTLRDATDALRKKIIDKMPLSEKIEQFVARFKKGEAYKGKEFFEWHNFLTGSCLFGRNQFVQDHNLSLEKDYTVEEFINLTKNDYGGDIIKELAGYYK